MRWFGIVAGRHARALRDASLAGLNELDLPGIAVGGLSVGEPKEDIDAGAAAHRPQGSPPTSRTT